MDPRARTPMLNKKDRGCKRVDMALTIYITDTTASSAKTLEAYDGLYNFPGTSFTTLILV